MRKHPRDAAAPLTKFADAPESQQPRRAPLHSIRASQQVRSVRIVARRRGY